MIWLDCDYDMGSSEKWLARNPVVHDADHHFPRNGAWARFFLALLLGKFGVQPWDDTIYDQHFAMENMVHFW